MWQLVCGEQWQDLYWVSKSSQTTRQGLPWPSEHLPHTHQSSLLITPHFSLSQIISRVYHVFVRYSRVAQHSANPCFSCPQHFSIRCVQTDSWLLLILALSNFLLAWAVEGPRNTPQCHQSSFIAHQLLALVASPHVLIYAIILGTWAILILLLHDQCLPLVSDRNIILRGDNIFLQTS